jgi:CRP-like cAMP-binding protein
MSEKFTRIRANVLQKINLSEAELTHFETFLTPKMLKKKEFLLTSGQVSRATAFVSKGLLRSYSIDQKGEEHVLQFTPEDWWVGDVYSALTGKPSSIFIDAVEDSEILLLGNADQERLFVEIPAFERFFRILIQNRFVALQERINGSLSLTAEEKYHHFLEKYASLPQRVPQHQIASYLGIQPETLSRIRKKISK